MCFTYGLTLAFALAALLCLSTAQATDNNNNNNKQHQLLLPHHSHSHHHNGHHQSPQPPPPGEQHQSDYPNGKQKNAVSEDIMYNYLMQFDYLPKSDLETGALRSEEQFTDAIRNLQTYGNIPVTGKIDAATAQLIQKQRCGVGDNKYANNFSPDNLDHGMDHGNSLRVRRYVLQGAKWDKTDLTWSLVNQSMPEADKIRIMVARALNVWESNSKLTFREVYSSQADIQVLFARRDHGDSYKFDGPGQVLAHAFYPGTGRGGDAHFDADEQWEFESSTDDSRGTNFLNVAVHELGHSLGLGHSSDSNAIMFPWYQNNEVEGKLPDDDRLGIQELYGAKSKTWGVYRPQTTPSTTSTTTTTTTTMRSYYPQVRPKNPNRHPYYPNYYPNKDRSRDRDRYTTTTTTTTSTTRAPATRRTAATRSPHKPYYYPGYPTYGQRHNKPIKPIKRKPKPDKCLTNYDAISMIRGELFIFRGQFLWRIGTKGLYNDEATETRSYWSVLPEDFGKVDAVYENKQHQIVFFIGRQYYVFDSVSLAPGYPQPLTSLGLPPSLTHIDAAFVWGYNNRTYLTSGTLYWRIDEFTGKVELDYPRDMSIWAGVGYNIDAAFQWENGKTYFFKNLGYWEFNDARMKVAHARPKLSARHWMKCPRNANDVDEEQRWTSPLVSGSNETTAGNAAAGSTKQIYRLTLCLVLLFTSLA